MRRARLWAEFLGLYLVAPVAIAILLPAERMFTALAAVTLLGLGLLWRSGGFDWTSLAGGWDRVRWTLVLGLGLVTTAAGTALLALVRPEDLFGLWRFDAGLFLAVMVLYPFLSALPQELVFRVLFFHRYGPILPAPRRAVALNAVFFALAHLMYWSWVVAAATLIGGAIFAAAYRSRGFAEAWLLHAVAGNVLFAIGMGSYFYSGNVIRPF